MGTNLQHIKSKLQQYQNKIYKEVGAYLINELPFMSFENWFTSSEEVHLYNQHGKLYISVDHAKREYISFLEENNSYGILPKNQILVLPESEIEVFVSGELLGEIEATLILVEYSNEKKNAIHNINVNRKKKIKILPTTRYLRIALKVSNSGVCIIKKIQFKTLSLSQPKLDNLKLSSSKNKSAIKNLKDLKVACIFDHFTTTCFQNEVDLITFSPKNWESVLLKNVPDVLMVESAWKGNNGTWEFKIAKYNNQDQTSLFSLLKWCKERNIPTVFWNKEDPIHFNKFIHTAKHFDYIFTTDKDMVDRYVELVGHNNVYPLLFSAEPKLHNPIKIVNTREDKICFAGSYYANRHEDRKKDMNEVLNICLTYGLTIYDRNYERTRQGATGFEFPDRFKSSIVGSLKYDEIDKAYKGYKMMLNVNSVKDSPTMFSRRVFEGLSCGTPIISTYSKGIKKIFKDIVLISENKSELEENLEKLLKDELFYREKSLEGIREVFLNHTYKHRIKFILDKIGINYALTYPKVTVIGVAHTQGEFFELIGLFEKQTWIEKELVIFIDNFDGYVELLNNYNNNDTRTYLLTYLPNYNRLTEIVNTEFVAFFASKNFYGENYLLDLMIATIYSGGDIIGKWDFYSYRDKVIELDEVNIGTEYEYTSSLYIDTCVIKPEVFKGEELTGIINKFISMKTMNDYFRKGFRLFSADKFNFLRLGRNAPETILKKVEL